MPAWAQAPHINYRGVVNAASFTPPGLPSGAIARGSTISIFGSGIGPASTPTLSFPLQNTLGGVSIRLTQGSTTVNAIPVFVSGGQVNAIVPSNAPLGQVSLVLNYNGASSNAAPVSIVNSNFGIFAVAAGRGPGILQDFISQTSQPVNSLSQAAEPNQTITLWGTGLGPAAFPDNVAPSTVNLPIQTEVFVGGVSAKVLYNGRSGCCAGIDQIVFQVPPNVALGCWVPVYVRTLGTAVSNFVTMSISANGSQCSESSNALPKQLLSGGRNGTILPMRVAVHHDVNVANVNDTVSDVLGTYFAQENAGDFNFNPVVSLPPAGTCTVYTASDDIAQNEGFPPGMTEPVATGRALDAGAISAGGNASLPGQFTTLLGSAIPTIPGTPSTLVFQPGNIAVSGGGGADVSSFQTQVAIPQPLNWTNRDQLQNITRSQGFTANWSGAAAGNSVFVTGAGTDLPANASAVFLCLAKPGDTSLTVPADVLANVPAAHARLVQSRGVIYVGQWPVAAPLTFTATGLDAGVVVPVEISGRTVKFQ